MSSTLSFRLFLLSAFLLLSVHSIYFVNVWHSCVDVAVEANTFPVSLVQSSKYYQVCPAQKEHWRRFGSGQFRLRILRTSEPQVEKYVDLQHNGYIHFHNETRQTVARRYGAEHEEL